MTARHLTLLASAALACAAPQAAAAAPVAWHTAWGRSQATSPTTPPLTDQTVRVVSRLTAGGTQVRVRVQNAFGRSSSVNGTAPLTIDAATVGRRSAGPGVVPGTLRPLTFAGRRDVTVPPGGSVLSDPVALVVTAGEDLAVSAHTPLAAMPPAHLFDTVTNYISGSGDATGNLDGAPFTTTTTTTPLIAAVDVSGTPLAGTVVAIGGSVVDGTGSTLDGHDAWPDDLARRLQALPAARHKAVVNAGIGTTTAARACASPLGQGVQDRVKRDALSLAGVTDLIVYAGTNDLSGFPAGVNTCNAAQIIDAMRDTIRQAHAAGARVFITSITPRASYSETQNADRALVNAWVAKGGNCSGECDHALDFDAVVRDPGQPNRIAPSLDSGDGIHPNPKGYSLIADSIDLALLSPAPVVPACRSRRSVRFTIPKGASRVRVLVNGRPVRARRSGRAVIVDFSGDRRRQVRVTVLAAGGFRRVTTLRLCTMRTSGA